MLTVTAEAADAVKKLVAEPDAADQVAGAEGSQIFVEPNAAQFLDDKVLHASFEDQSIRFATLTLPGTDA